MEEEQDEEEEDDDDDDDDGSDTAVSEAEAGRTTYSTDYSTSRLH